MGRTIDLLEILLVTLKARFSALVFDGKVLPFLDIAKAMIPVGEILAVHTEVVRHHKCPRDKNGPDQSDRHP